MAKRNFHEGERVDPGPEKIPSKADYLEELQKMKDAVNPDERYQAYLRVIEIGLQRAETFRESVFPYRIDKEGYHQVTEDEFRHWDEERRAIGEALEAAQMKKAERAAESRRAWDQAAKEGRLAELLDAQSDAGEVRQFPRDVLRAARDERKKKRKQPKSLGKNIGDAIDSMINWFNR